MSGGGVRILTIDIAHPPMHPSDAERALDETLRRAALAPEILAVRIVHGYGSGGRGGALRAVARNWAYARRSRIAAVVPGEEFSPTDPAVGELIAGGGLTLSDLGTRDPGWTLIVPR